MRRTAGSLLKRLARAVFVLLFAVTLVFVVVHLGLHAPADTTEGSVGQPEQLEQKKQAFGLTRPLSVQYVDYVEDMFTLDFGETWTERDLAVAEAESSNDVNAIVYHRLKRTGWLWLWTGLVTFGIVLLAGLINRTRGSAFVSVAGGLAYAPPVFLLAIVFQSAFFNLGTLLFGLDWRTFLAPTPSTITRPIPLDALGTLDGFLLAAKLAFPPALALALPLAATTTLVWRRGEEGVGGSNFVTVARAKGVRSAVVEAKHVLPNAILPIALVAGQGAAVLVGGTMLVELIFELDGLGSLFFSSAVRNDYTTLQATWFVLVAFVVGVTLVADVVYLLAGGRFDAEDRHRLAWTASWTSSGEHRQRAQSRRLSPVPRDDGTVAAVRATPRPALFWLAGGVVLVVLEFGAVVDVFGAFVPGVGHLGDFPSLLDRDLVSNSGYRTPDGGWVGTFLGLPPSYAWTLRVTLVYAYACAWVAWLWAGFRLYVRAYRPTKWTPTDDVFTRLRNHRLIQFGLIVVFVFLVAAIFAPSVGPTTPDRTNSHTTLDDGEPDPGDREELAYFDAQAGEVKTTTVGTANAESGSTALASVGPMSYDAYDRFHPAGTTYSGTDLLTEMLHGLRVYLFVAGVSMVLASALAVTLGGLSSYSSGFVDGAISTLADSLTALPMLPLVFMLSGLFYPKLYGTSSQLGVWALLFGVVVWPHLWRTIRLPLARVKAAAWIDADRALGRSDGRIAARTIRHVLGPIAVYVLIGAAGVVVATAALSYLGHMAPAVPYGAYEWGSLLWRGNQFMLSKAGHTFIVPAVALVLLVIALNALAAGLRDALELADGVSAPGEFGRLGGGG